MMRINKLRGTTLVEVLVAMAIMALFVTGVTQLLLTGYRAGMKGSGGGKVFLSGMDTLNSIGEELRSCDQIINPYYNWPDDGAYVPEDGVSLPFVFKRYRASTKSEIVVAYMWDSKSHELKRSVYPPGMTPELVSLIDSAPRESEGVIGTSVEKFQIEQLGAVADPIESSIVQFLRIDLTVLDRGTAIPLQIKVRTHGL